MEAREVCGVCTPLLRLNLFLFFAGLRLSGSGRARIRFLKGMCDCVSSWDLSSEFVQRSRDLSQIFPKETRHCPGDAGFQISKGGKFYIHLYTHQTHGRMLSHVIVSCTYSQLPPPPLHSAMAPPNYCINGGRTERCKPPRCPFSQIVFANWTNPNVFKFGPWFNQFVRFSCPCSLMWQCLRGNNICTYIFQFLENIMLRRWKTTKWKFQDPIVIVPSPYTQCIRG